MKIILKLLLALLLAFAMMPLTAGNAHADSDNGTTETGKTMIPDNGIPVLSINIDPEEYQKVITSADHSYRAQGGSISITVPGGYTGEYSETPLPDQENLELEYLRGRGNSTWVFPKKPFKFKLDKSTNLLGMGSNKHWVLMANAYDGTMMKNRIIAYMGRQIGLDFTPMYTPVDLVVNGEYRGSYTLAHQVRIGKSRVNIAELGPADIEEPEVTGGYLLQLEPYGDEGKLNIFETRRKVRFTTNDPVFESDDEDDTLGAPEQRKYIFSYLQQIEDAIYGEGFQDENGISYRDLMDIRSAAAYWMIQDFSYNTDAFGTPSTYLYKDREGKLCWGPLWDTDLTFDPELGSEGFGHCRVEWLDYIRAFDPVYQEELRQVWKEYDPIITEIVRTGGLLDRYKAELAESWKDNDALSEAENWAEDAFFDVDYESLEAEITKLKEYMTARQKWYRENIDTEELSRVFCTVTFKADGKVIKTSYAYYDSGLTGAGAPPLSSLSKDGYVAVGWNDEEGNPVEEYLEITEDRTLTARYIPEEEAIFADGLYFRQYEYWFDPEVDQFIETPYTITPENAEERSIAWTTSDPEVAAVDENGQLEIKGLGDATITGRLRSGTQTSYQVHVRNREDIPMDPVTALQAETDTLTLKPGECGQVRITTVPVTADVRLGYMSGDDEIADVYASGVVQAISPGTCTMVVRDSKTKVTTEFTVIVEDNSEEIAGLKAQLAEYVEAASRDLAAGRYTSDSVRALEKRIAEAEAVIDDENAYARDIDICQVRLLRAWRLLEPAGQGGEDPDRTLKEAIDALTKDLTEINDTVVPDLYTEASYGKLAEVLAKAGQVLADDTSTVAQLRAVRTELLEAWQALEKKSPNTLTVKGRTVKLKAKKLKKKARTVKIAKALEVSRPCGTVRYTLKGVRKAKFRKYFKVNSKTGRITVKKGLKKGTYKVRIKVSAEGDGEHLPGAEIAAVKVKVR